MQRILINHKEPSCTPATCLPPPLLPLQPLPLPPMTAKHLDTIFIKTQRSYSADATENSRDYSAFAATVGTKIPATPREIPQSISDAFADVDHYFANGAYGKIGLRYSDRDAESNYAFASSALDDQLQVTPTGLGTNIKQKALAFDASYSQPFNWGAMRNEYVVGADYNHFKTSNEQGRARTLGAARDYRSLGSLPYTNILGNARAGSRGFARTLDEETLDEAGVYGKLVVRPLENLSLIGGGTAKEKRHGTPLTGYAGVVWDFSKTDSLYASYSSLYRPQTAIDRNGRLLKPRRGDQIEIGHKGSYLGDRLNTRVGSTNTFNIPGAERSVMATVRYEFK